MLVVFLTKGYVVNQSIHIPVRKEDQQKIIRCVVEHEALQTEMEAATELDIQCK